MQVKNFVKILSYIISIITFFPVYPYIKPLYIYFFILSMVLSFKLEFEKRAFLNILSIIFILFALRNISFNNMVIPILHSIIILLSIKFLEKKKYRDYMQIYLLSIFILAGFALLSLSIYFLIYLSVIIFLLTIAAVFLTYFNENENMFLNRETLIKICSNSSVIFLMSIPIALLIFFILPRIEYPFFDFLNQEKALTGFSDKISLGDIKEIKEDTSVIFRSKMQKIPEKYLYWRGITLEHFNGNSWERKNSTEIERKNIGLKGRVIKQTILLEPYYNKYLFALDKPVELSLKHSQITNDLSLIFNKQIYHRIKYIVYSIPTDKIFQLNIQRKNYLQLPENLSQDIIKLGKKLKTYENIINFFKKNHFKYTLSNLPVSKKPLRDFLFKYKMGNCEYFASAFALLMRISGIPSRIVAGYKGGIYSNFGKYYIVTQNNAHVWVEVYIKNYWKRVDPTIFASQIIFPQKDKNLNLKILIDLINYYWINLFINYDFNTQMNFALKLHRIKIKKTMFLHIFVYIIFLLLLFFFIKNFKIKTTEKLLVDNFLKTLEKKGYVRKKRETLLEFVQKIKEPVIREKTELFVKLYQEAFFKDKKFSKNLIYRLKKILKQIKS